MKRKLYLLMVIISFSFILLLTGCFNDDPGDDLERGEDFSGYQKGATWKYNFQWLGEDDTGYEDYTETNTVIKTREEGESTLFFVENISSMEIRSELDEDSRGSIIEKRDDEIYYWGYWGVKEGEIDEHPNEIPTFQFRENMSVGDEGFFGRTLKSKDERVTVSAGVFDAWHFKYVDHVHEGYRDEIWFVPGIGIVKEVFIFEEKIDGEWKIWEGEQIELIDYTP